MNDELLDDWAVCQILINQAIEEMYEDRQPDPMREPWGGLFAPKS